MELKDEERQRCEIWTRVMGYHRPVSEWNKGKKAEYKERTFFKEKKGVKMTNKDIDLSLKKGCDEILAYIDGDKNACVVEEINDSKVLR